MTVVVGSTFALAGLAIGSFLTVVVERVPAKRSIVLPRSSCPRCGAMIRPRDNIPVVSWILLRGRCRDCGARISPMYPFLELLTAGLFVGAAFHFHPALIAVMMALFLALMVAVAAIDARHRVIPNRIVYPAFLIFGAFVIAGALAGIGLSAANAGIGLALYGGGLLLVALIVPKGMGMGDVKLAGLIGLVLGSLGLSYVAVAAGAAVLAGGLGSVAVLVATGKARGQTIPFGPYLALGAVVAAFAAPQIAHAYMHLLGRA